MNSNSIPQSETRVEWVIPGTDFQTFSLDLKVSHWSSNKKLDPLSEHPRPTTCLSEVENSDEIHLNISNSCLE